MVINPERLLPGRKKEMGWTESLIPGWMPPEHCRKIFEILCGIRAEKIVEIGSFMGRTAHVAASAFKKLGVRGKLVCVDWFSWKMKKNPLQDPAYVVLRENYPEACRLYFDEHHIHSGREGFDLTLRRFPFMKEYLDLRACDSKFVTFEGESFDFALLDGGHLYEEVRSDFEKIRGCLHPGSILCLDDNKNAFPGVQRLVRELKENPGLEAFESFGKLQFFRVLAAGLSLEKPSADK